MIIVRIKCPSHLYSFYGEALFWDPCNRVGQKLYVKFLLESTSKQAPNKFLSTFSSPLNNRKLIVSGCGGIGGLISVNFWILVYFPRHFFTQINRQTNLVQPFTTLHLDSESSNCNDELVHFSFWQAFFIFFLNSSSGI